MEMATDKEQEELMKDLFKAVDENNIINRDSLEEYDLLLVEDFESGNQIFIFGDAENLEDGDESEIILKDKIIFVFKQQDEITGLDFEFIEEQMTVEDLLATMQQTVLNQAGGQVPPGEAPQGADEGPEIIT